MKPSINANEMESVGTKRERANVIIVFKFNQANGALTLRFILFRFSGIVDERGNGVYNTLFQATSMYVWGLHHCGLGLHIVQRDGSEETLVLEPLDKAVTRYYDQGAGKEHK